MAEFIRPEEKVVNVSEPVIFENNTDSDFSVSAAVVFRKSGLYNVSIVGRRTVVSKVGRTNAKRRIGEWIKDDSDWFETMFRCSECGALIRKQDKFRSFFCYHCGADMRGKPDE